MDSIRSPSFELDLFPLEGVELEGAYGGIPEMNFPCFGDFLLPKFKSGFDPYLPRFGTLKAGGLSSPELMFEISLFWLAAII